MAESALAIVAESEARDHPEVSLELVTPGQARLWLGANIGNRELRGFRAEALTRAFARGEGSLTPDALAFDTEGHIVNGQHRLVAIARSDTPLPMIVLRGFSRDVIDRMDTGQTRTLADMLQQRGYHDWRNLAPVLNYLWRYLAHGSLATPKVRPTAHEQIEMLERNPDAIQESMRFGRKMRDRGPVPVSITGTLHYIFRHADEDDATTFFSRVAGGNDLREGDQLHVLRRQLERAALPRSRADYKPPPVVQAAWIVKAWNAWQEGAAVKTYSWRPARGEAFPAVNGVLPEDVDDVLGSRVESPLPPKIRIEEIVDGGQ